MKGEAGTGTQVYSIQSLPVLPLHCLLLWLFAKLLPGVAPRTTVLEDSADTVAKMITSSINRALPHGPLQCHEAPARPQTSSVGTPREAAVGEHYVLSTASKFSPPNWWGREEKCLHFHCFSSSLRRGGGREPGWILLMSPSGHKSGLSLTQGQDCWQKIPKWSGNPLRSSKWRWIRNQGLKRHWWPIIAYFYGRLTRC